MSYEEIVASGCEGKQPLPRNKATALARKQLSKGTKAINAYKCRFCGKWHVGKMK